MKTEVKVTNAAAVQELLDLDHPSTCSFCRPSDAATAHDSLAELGKWWLDPAQRRAWEVETLIEGKKRPDRTASDVVFKIVLRSRPTSPVPVFMILTQHWEGKQDPHYQLQIPDRVDLRRAAGIGAERAVMDMMDAAEQRIAYLQFSGKKSISLHEPLSEADMECVKSTLAELVVKLRALL